MVDCRSKGAEGEGVGGEVIVPSRGRGGEGGGMVAGGVEKKR